MTDQAANNSATSAESSSQGRRLVRNCESISPATRKLLKRLHLNYVTTDALTIRRKRHGRGFRYITADGSTIGVGEAQRLASLAVPPAYQDVLYAEDPRAHIQAIGRDGAGRLQYRYHPDWQRVRETRKACRLARLAEALPQIQRCVQQHLETHDPTRAFTLAAIIELVARSAIRPGTEQYAKLRGTRGAATLLKSNVSIFGETICLCFRAKGGKQFQKELRAPKLATALAVLRRLPGRRLFQYRAEDGTVRLANAQDVNRFLREIAGVKISLKDFRTLLASVSVLETLARTEPATSKRARQRQVLDAIAQAAGDLGNTPAICRKSYVHETVISAFEEGMLGQFARTLRSCRSTNGSARFLAKMTAHVEKTAA